MSKTPPSPEIGSQSDNVTDVDIEMELLIQAIYHKYKYDFRNYSRSSVKRRLLFAVERLGLKSISHLQEKVIHEKQFLANLLDYMTVPTTEIFRDPTYFKSVREQVLPFLKTFPSLKIWIAGCSTGEEVYSLAILLYEENLLHKTILYATDINVQRLEHAKQGIYSSDVIQKGTLNYRAAGGLRSFSDYVVGSGDHMRMSPSLSKNIVFSDHSLATDEVFAEVHMVSCRNLLIYFDRELQDRSIGLFSRSLVRGGFLGLGSKESLRFMKHANDFRIAVSEDKIYQKV